MAHPLNSRIDNLLRRAEKNGDFENLPGVGKPLENLSDPKDAVLNRIMTEARVKPPIIALKEKITESHSRLKALTDDAERKSEMKILSDLQMRLTMQLEAFRRYG